MNNNPERFTPEPLPLWIPPRVREALAPVLRKDPIDLTSPEVIGTRFVTRAEVDDVYDIIRQIEQPILIGMNGSRASLARPPLFPNLEAFDAYYNSKGDVSQYLEEQEGFSFEEYEAAREALQQGFNQSYSQGQQYSVETVRLLVSDIDLLIVSEGRSIRGGTHIGKRTNTTIEINSHSPYQAFDADPKDLENYIELGLAQTVPLKY